MMGLWRLGSAIRQVGFAFGRVRDACAWSLRMVRDKYLELRDAVRAWAKQNPRLWLTLRIALITIAAVAAAYAVFILILHFLGFTASGVAAGSAAAAIQSAVYGANTAGLFSVLQSLGATIVFPTGVAIVAAATLLAGLTTVPT